MGEDPETDERPLRADAQRNRRRILDAAAEVFAVHGLDAGLDQIAEHAGLGVGTVYRRFPDKNALIDELFEARLAEFVSVAEECAAMEDAWTGLTTFIARGSLLQGRNIGMRELLLGPGLDRKLVHKPRALLQPLVSGMVDRAKASGKLRADFDVLDVPIAEMMLAQVIDVTGEFAPDAWKRHYTLVIDGMRAENTTPFPAPAITPEQYFAAFTRRGS
ncbi:MAG TPA: helix-turn-helix domain-containing protein [Solirubrobacterales bacterium]|nr:helix-turn-helix domain-containing protein [Solirubrobacterales bacterium]